MSTVAVQEQQVPGPAFGQKESTLSEAGAVEYPGWLPGLAGVHLPSLAARRLSAKL